MEPRREERPAVANVSGGPGPGAMQLREATLIVADPRTGRRQEFELGGSVGRGEI